MPTKYWIVLNITPHDTFPISHSEQLTLKAYFDEDPDDVTDEKKEKGSDEFTVPSEHSIILPKSDNITTYHMITHDEYTKGHYRYYIWTEPYASAAIQYPGHSDAGDIALGRMRLTNKEETYRGPAAGLSNKPKSIASDDCVISFNVKLADSVVQFIVNEMNANSRNDDILKHGKDLSVKQIQNNEAERVYMANDRLKRGDYRRLRYARVNLKLSTKSAEDTIRHYTHKNEGMMGFAQDIAFRGGGEWDHKPVIRPVWGTDNRLGNRAEWYYYDNWSNMHFGFIGETLNLPLNNLLNGASRAQNFDNSSSRNQNNGDDPVDAQGIVAGYELGQRKSKVSRDDILSILLQPEHAAWRWR